MKIFDTSSIVCLLREAECPEAFEICKKYGYELGITKQVYEELKENPETRLYFSINGYQWLSYLYSTDTYSFLGGGIYSKSI